MGQSKICFAKSCFVLLGQHNPNEYSPNEFHDIDHNPIGQIHERPFDLIRQSKGCAIPAIAYFIAVWKENHLRPGKSSIQKAQLAMDI
jgi:hypothetical protein